MSLIPKLRLKNALLVGAVASLIPLAASAKAPLSKSDLPVLARIHVGKFEVTALSDGTIDLPMSKLLTTVKPEEIKSLLAAQSMTDPFETSVNAFLVNTGDKLVLIDSGAGTNFGPTLGKMMSNLKVAGYSPEQVDAVLITHMHPDHVGGLVADGKIAFPNATVYADQAESDFWLTPENMKKANDTNKGFFEATIASLKPYKEAGKLKALPSEAEVVPGIKSVSTTGHTTGHSLFAVESEGQKLLIIGDLVHVAAVQFGKPTAAIAFDLDAKTAVQARMKQFKDAAEKGYLIAGSHLSFPGVGHIQKSKNAFRYIPVNHTR